MVAEGELRSNLDESDRVRELQDKVAELKAEVYNATSTQRAARYVPGLVLMNEGKF